MALLPTGRGRQMLRDLDDVDEEFQRLGTRRIRRQDAELFHVIAREKRLDAEVSIATRLRAVAQDQQIFRTLDDLCFRDREIDTG